MVEPAAEPTEIAAEAERASAVWRWQRPIALAAALIVIGLAVLWWQRETLAHRIIASQLSRYDLPATYQIEQIGPRRQVLSNIVVGDPKRPDFTARRIEVTIVPTLGLPTIGSVTAVEPRLYGSYRSGKLSFGSLDKALFGPSDGPPGLPDMNLRIEDGRGRIDSDFGPIGFKLDGRGNLRQAFVGELAAVGPEVRIGSCRLTGTTVFGKVTGTAGKPGFAGPVRLKSAGCDGWQARDLNLALVAQGAADLASWQGKGQLAGGALQLGDQQIRSVAAQFDALWRGDSATARYRLRGDGLGGQLAADWISLEGVARSADGLARVESEGRLTGEGLRLGQALDQQLAAAQTSAAGTLGVPLLAKLRQGLQREGARSSLDATFSLRQSGVLTSIVLPEGQLTGTSGAALLVISRGQVALGGAGGLRLSGNVRTGGENLPQFSGQVDRQPGGAITARLAMAEYRAGDAALALPELVVVQRANGAIGFAGEARASGALPGGRVTGLTIPLDGTWTARGGLLAWRACTNVRFGSLSIANLTLDARALRLCPGRGGAILVSGPAGTRFAAGTAGLALAGRLGSTPISLTSGAIGFAYPGTLAATKVNVALGQANDPSRFAIATLTGQLGPVMTGTFAGMATRLAAVPLDVLEAAGNWRFADGRLDLSEASFRLEDRTVDDRFQPLLARDATLSLANNRIAAFAALREPKTDRLITETRIQHDLTSGQGHADLAVPGVLFDNRLQPDELTYLALGVVANAEGTVTGKGRIDWTERNVTSTGQFSTEKLDFAAAFGPVTGVSGTVEFTDLLGLVTAPDQRLKIGSINPGIEVFDGELRFQLQGENLLVVNGAEWPFVDGRLQLLPTRIQLGAVEQRRFTLRVIGADAAQFVQQLELSNIAARGLFDGDLPLVFDENGGRIEGGLLISRPPGGNLSYLGALSYENLGSMGNFAFQALRSLNFQRMEVGIGGELDGDIFTQVRIDGVTQGDGARRNFVTRQIGKLPIRFNINIRAPFQRLLSSFRSLYDPSAVRDPRDLGLIDNDGRALDQSPRPSPAQPGIQPPDSRKMP